MTDFTRQSWWSVLLLSIITLGIYIPFWYKKTKKVTDELPVEKKLTGKYVNILLALLIARIPFNITVNWTVNEEARVFTTNFYNIGDVLSLATVGLLIWLGFELRSVLLQHYNMNLNEIWTALLGPVYLQEKINETLLSETTIPRVPKDPLATTMVLTETEQVSSQSTGKTSQDKAPIPPQHTNSVQK